MPNWTLRIYDFDGCTRLHEESFFASTEVTADKTALSIVERDWPGYDWTLMPLNWQDES